jgi:hypothetical protein
MDKDKERQGTHLTEKAKRQAEEKQKRLAEALRSNLHRRKAQSRARIDPPSGQGDARKRDG